VNLSLIAMGKQGAKYDLSKSNDHESQCRPIEREKTDHCFILGTS
jgi:hypothetical protein